MIKLKIFLEKLTNNGTIERRTAFVRIVNGPTMFSDKVTWGVKTARTTIAKASAPPNNPSLHINKTKGATINEIPVTIKIS